MMYEAVSRRCPSCAQVKDHTAFSAKAVACRPCVQAHNFRRYYYSKRKIDGYEEIKDKVVIPFEGAEEPLGQALAVYLDTFGMTETQSTVARLLQTLCHQRRSRMAEQGWIV